MRRVLMAIVATLTLAAPSFAADESRRVSPLLWVAYGHDAGPGVGVGLRYRLGEKVSRLHAVGVVAVHFPESASPYDVTVSDPIYALRVQADVVAEWRFSAHVGGYVGVGLAVDRSTHNGTLYSGGIVRRYRYSTPTTTAPELVGGAEFGRGRVRPFIQGTVEYDFQRSEARVAAGLRF